MIRCLKNLALILGTVALLPLAFMAGGVWIFLTLYALHGIVFVGAAILNLECLL